MVDADRTIDVREIPGPPFGEIVDALDALGEDERLYLVSEFEPAPLYGLLEERGFSHEAERADGTWRVTIERA